MKRSELLLASLDPHEAMETLMSRAVTYTLDEVAKVFRVTRERIRQIQTKAIHKLRLRWPKTERVS